MGLYDQMLKGAKPAQIPLSLHTKLLAVGETLAGGFKDQVPDDIKIAAAIVYYMSGTKETNMFDSITSIRQKGVDLKENTMKRHELKALIKEVVKHCVREAGPQYKVVGRKSQMEEPGKRNRAREMQDDPEVNEVAPPGGEDVVKALKKKSSVDNPWAVAWAMKNKGQIESEGMEGGEDHPYDEEQEVRLIKQVAVGVLKLLQMHADEEPEVPAGAEPKAPPFPPKKKTPEKSEEPEPKDDENKEEVDESNHKVQHRSYTTVKDLPNDPKNVRDPKVPQP